MVSTVPLANVNVIMFDVSATARAYQQAVDLVDRLEHGERLLRVVSLQIDANDRGLTIAATLLGLSYHQFRGRLRKLDMSGSPPPQ